MSASAAAFGQNKVRYKDFNWQVLHTEHFEIYYYPEAEALAYEACEEAERVWKTQTEFFRLSRPPGRKVPIFLYATFHDFIQTNVTPEPLGEGVGGFTEALKTRVVLPLGASEAARLHVLAHELVHAHQFFILYGEGVRSYSLYKSVLVPIWFMEGMAEHVSHGWNPQGEAVLRDAVLHDRLPRLWEMHSFNHLEPHDAYLGYKAGHSAMDFLGERYGEDKIPAILKGVDDARMFSQVFANKAGITLTEFDRRWRDHLKETYWSQVKGKKDPVDYGPGLVVNRTDRTGLSGGAAQSPVDDTIAYLSDRQGFRNLYLMRKGRSGSAVFGSGRSGSIGASHPDWSPDGKLIAVVMKEGPRSVIALVDAKRRKVRRKLSFPFLDVTQPRFHPDGRSLVFVGFNGTKAEVFIADAMSGAWRAVTADGASAGSPVFTPDGRTIIYESETPGGVVLKSVAADAGAPAAGTPLGGERPVRGSHPDLSPDGALLLYDSASDGIPNLYVCRPDGTGRRKVTDVRTAMYGARFARDGKRLLASAYEHGSQNVYLLAETALMAAKPVPEGLLASDGAAGAAPEPVESPAATPALRPSLPAVIPPSRLAPPAQEFRPGLSAVSAPRGTGGIATFGIGEAWAAEAPRPQPLPTRPPAAVSAPPLSPLWLSALVSGPDVILTWTPPAAPAAVSRYEVFRSTRPGAPGTILSVVRRAEATSYRDGGWNYGEPYEYRVRALDEAGAPLAEGRVPVRVKVDVWPAPYRFSLSDRLVDVFVLLGSISVGAGTNFAGYGLLQLSDLPGDHHVAVQASAVPGLSNTYGVEYAFSGWRPDVSLALQANSWSRFVLVQNALSTESYRYPPLLTDLRGATLAAAYPLSPHDRLEAAAGIEEYTEVFTNRSDLSVIDRKTSRLLPVGAAYVRDTSLWRRLLPTGGYRLRLGVTRSIPASSAMLSLTEYNGEAQWYLGLLDDVSFAVRWWGAASAGRNRRNYYLGGRYSLRALAEASLHSPGVGLANHELRVNLFDHLNVPLPILPVLFTDVQGVGFLDAGTGFDPDRGITRRDDRPVTAGAGLNFIGFMFQASPILFSAEYARRIDRDGDWVLYGRLGPLF